MPAFRASLAFEHLLSPRCFLLSATMTAPVAVKTTVMTLEGAPGEENKTQFGLKSIDDVPEWARSSEHITTHYRPVSHSFLESYFSVLHVHNESGSILSHLFGLILSLSGGTWLLARCFADNPRGTTTADYLAFGGFWLGAILCMALSVNYHTTMNHSQSVATMGKQCDYFGITCLIWGSSVPTIRYTFTCDASLQKFYLSAVRCRRPPSTPQL